MVLSVRTMALALGISKSQAARDASEGMPMHDPAAAAAWRDEHRDLARVVGARLGRPASARSAGSTSSSPLATVHRLARLAEADFAVHERALRAALKHLSPAEREAMRLPVGMLSRLIGPVAMAWLHGIFGAAADPARLHLGADVVLHDLIFELAAGMAWVAVTLERETDAAS